MKLSRICCKTTKTHKTLVWLCTVCLKYYAIHAALKVWPFSAYAVWWYVVHAVYETLYSEKHTCLN